MPTIQALLENTSLPNSPSERLDTELLLSAVLNKPQSYLYTYPQQKISLDKQIQFQALINRRLQGEPIAYILGKQGFWSFDLQVNEQTLIPRPDTELLVETCLNHFDNTTNQIILDLGTGTGAIALAVAHERPNCQVIGVDLIDSVVKLALYNMQNLQVNNICFKQSNWFDNLTNEFFNIIVSNPPYIEATDPHLQQGDVKFEPLSALVSGKDGLDDIRLIIEQAPLHLFDEGWLFLEHGYQQASKVRTLLNERGFKEIKTVIDLGGNERVTGGQWFYNQSSKPL